MSIGKENGKRGYYFLNVEGDFRFLYLELWNFFFDKLKLFRF